MPPATTRKTTASETCCSATPATTKPNGPAAVATVITAVSTFGRSAGGVRTVITPMIGALISGVKNAKDADERNGDGPGQRQREQEERERRGDDREPRQSQKVDLLRELRHHDRADDGPCSDAGEDPTEDVRALVVPANDEHLQADRQALCGEIDPARGEEQRAEQPVAAKKVEPREHALRLRRACDASACAHHDRDRREREDVGGCVDDEHGGRARRRDDHARCNRAENLREHGDAAENAVELGDARSSSPATSGMISRDDE